MRQLKLFSVTLLTFFLCNNGAKSQTPSDALMMPGKKACVLLNYDFSHFDEYWEGDLLRKNQTIASIRIQSALPMVAVGIFDKLNLFVGVPYIKTQSTEPNGGKFAGAQGFQDFMVAMKWEIVKKTVANGELSALATVGFSNPLTNYLSDYKPYSIGNGAPELSYRGIVQYTLQNNFYLRVAGAYLWRGYTEAERDYYYNNGSYYTPWMDVPSAWQYELVLGKWFLEKRLKLELNYQGLKSVSGDDIRAYNAAQPTNKVNFDRVGISLQYYFKKVEGLGVVASHSRVLNGLNTGKLSSYGLGVTYQFYYLNNKK